MHSGDLASASDPFQLGGLSIAWFPISVRIIPIKVFTRNQVKNVSFCSINIPVQYHGTALQCYQSQDRRLDTHEDA